MIGIIRRSLRAGLCVLSLLCYSAPTLADKQPELNLEIKVALQAKLSEFLAQASAPDGGFMVLDRETAELKTLYAGALHPEIIVIGESYYLCVSMQDKTGQMVDADFLLRVKNGVQNPASSDDFILVDSIIDNRALLRKHLSLQRLKH